MAVDEEETNLAHNGVIHKYRLDRAGNRIGTHEFIRPKLFGGFHIEGLHTREVRSIPNIPTTCICLRMAIGIIGLRRGSTHNHLILKYPL